MSDPVNSGVLTLFKLLRPNNIATIPIVAPRTSTPFIVNASARYIFETPSGAMTELIASKVLRVIENNGFIPDTEQRSRIRCSIA